MALAYHRLKIVVEPGGAAALAAALFYGNYIEGDAVIAVATGGNVDKDVFEQALAKIRRHLMADKRRHFTPEPAKDFTIASFNVKNLIGAEQEYYRFEEYTQEEHAWKEDWLADQLLTMNADIVGFQEIFERPALYNVIRETNERGAASNADVIPNKSKRYHRKAIFKKLKYEDYGNDSLFFRSQHL